MSVQARRNSVEETLENALDYRPEDGVVRVNRKVFTDEELFDLEMRYIFEGNWIFLAHESQIPEVGDYYTTNIGRQPIMITRSKDGELNALINACSHRGAMLCRRKTDNRTTITCPFHGWTFSNDGRQPRPAPRPTFRKLPRLPVWFPKPRRCPTGRAPR